MKKFPQWFCLLMMAFMVLSCSGGCGGSDDDDSSPQAQNDRLMVITSPVLKKGESYKLYRGDSAGAMYSNLSKFDASYYVAPIDSGENVTINLEFADALSGDKPFMITLSEDARVENVVFFYNPKGNGSKDIATDFGGVVRYGGTRDQLSYYGLQVLIRTETARQSTSTAQAKKKKEECSDSPRRRKGSGGFPPLLNINGVFGGDDDFRANY